MSLITNAAVHCNIHQILSYAVSNRSILRHDNSWTIMVTGDRSVLVGRRHLVCKTSLYLSTLATLVLVQSKFSSLDCVVLSLLSLVCLFTLIWSVFSVICIVLSSLYCVNVLSVLYSLCCVLSSLYIFSGL